MYLSGEKRVGWCFRFVNWKPTRIGFIACPLGDVLASNRVKESVARVTCVETPVSKSILRVVQGSATRRFFLCASLLSCKINEDYGPESAGFEPARPTTAELPAAGPAPRQLLSRPARSNHPKQRSYSHLVPCLSMWRLVCIVSQLAHSRFPKRSVPPARFYRPAGVCYGRAAAFRDSERLSELRTTGGPATSAICHSL